MLETQWIKITTAARVTTVGTLARTYYAGVNTVNRPALVATKS